MTNINRLNKKTVAITNAFQDHTFKYCQVAVFIEKKCFKKTSSQNKLEKDGQESYDCTFVSYIYLYYLYLYMYKN